MRRARLTSTIIMAKKLETTPQKGVAPLGKGVVALKKGVVPPEKMIRWRGAGTAKVIPEARVTMPQGGKASPTSPRANARRTGTRNLAGTGTPLAGTTPHLAGVRLAGSARLAGTVRLAGT